MNENLSCLLRLHKEDLERCNLKKHQRWLWKQFEGNYNGFLIILKSNFGKVFAFYIPSKFEETNYKLTDKQLGFYWINGDQLVTMTNSKNPVFRSTDK